MKDKVEKRASIREKYEKLANQGDKKVLGKLQSDFQDLSKDLSKYDREAARDEKILELRTSFQ